MPIVVEGASVKAAGEGAGGRNVLVDLSCTLREEEITVIVGRSGAGKSTLLEALAGMRELQAGGVRYGDAPLWQGRRLNPDVNRAIGFVCQQPEQHLFAASVQREFSYSLRHLRLEKSEAAARIRAALRDVQLPEEVLERSPLTLSAGQQRRVALATVFAAAPGWLFLDEPTAGLDPPGVAALTTRLRRWKERSGGGIVIATHDLDALLPLADRVLVLDGGVIAADMTPQQLCGQPQVLPALGVGRPGYVELAALLAAAGLPVAADSSADAMAAAISGLLRDRAAGAAAAKGGDAAGGEGTAVSGGAAKADVDSAQRSVAMAAGGEGTPREEAVAAGGEWKAVPNGVAASTYAVAGSAAVHEAAHAYAAAAEPGIAANAPTAADVPTAAANAPTAADVPTAAANAPTAADFLTAHAEASPSVAAAAEASHAVPVPARTPSVPAAPAVQQPAWGWVLTLDPRAKWLFLGLVSAATLLQTSWSGIACSAAAVLAVAACCRYPLRRFWPVLRAYAWFVALSAVLSGLQLGGGDGGLVSGLRFSVPHALTTVQPLVRLVPVMLLGLLFGRTTSYAQVKRGLEQALAPFRRWRAQVEALTFTAAMMFRLIPLLTQLFARLSRIARTRGKSRAKQGALALRDVPVVLVPFLLAAFQLAEQLSLAAEAKGYRIGGPRTSAVSLRFRRSDVWTVAAGGGIFIILWMLRG